MAELHDLFDLWARNPSRQSLWALLEGAQDPVYTVCFNVLRHREDAEDASQAVFVELLNRIGTIVGGEHFRRWLYRVSLHTALNVKRTRVRRERHEALIPAPDPHRHQAADAVHEQLARLDDEARALVVQYYFEKRTLEALATERGCSSVAVWKRIEKAKKALRKSLAGASMGSVLPQFDRCLEGSGAFRAPRGLLSKAPIVQAAAAAGVASSAASFALGGFLVKARTALLLSVVALGLAGTVGYAAFRRRATPPDAAAPVALPTKSATPSPSRTASSVAGVGPAVRKPTDVATELFASWDDYFAALYKGFALPKGPERWARLRRLGFPLSDEEFEKAARRRRRSSHPKADFGEALMGVVAQWMERDVEGPSRLIVERGAAARPSGTMFLAGILELWVAQDPTGALAFARLLPLSEGRSELLERLEAKADPVAAVERLKGLPEGAQRDVVLRYALGPWARRDPAAAAAWAAEISDRNQRTNALGSTVSEWAGRDAEAALAWVRAHTGAQAPSPGKNAFDTEATEREHLFTCYLQGLGQSDPRKATDLALRWYDPAGTEGWMVYSSIGRAWIEKDPSGALEFIRSLPEESPVRKQLLPELVADTVLNDPAAGLALAQKLPEGEERRAALMAAVGAWVKADRHTPQDALALLDQLPRDLRTGATQEILGHWADLDPEGAAEFAKTQSPDQRAASLGRIAQRWAELDLEGALGWAKELAPLTVRNEALRHIVMKVAGRDPGRALALAGEITTTEGQAQACRWISVTAPDPAAARAAFEKIGAPTFTDYLGFTGAWGRKNPMAALEWISSLPETIRDPGSQGEVSLRGELADGVLTTWAQRDYPAALEWIRQAPVPEESKAQWRKNIERSRR